METTPPLASISILPEPKSIFKSRTAVLGTVTAIAGAAGSIWPDAGATIAAHASAILLVAGILQVVLRLASHGRVVLFPAE